MRNIKVVDYTFGRKSSDDVDTSLPFTENFKEAKTIQQANAVICAYVNANYKDIQDKQDKLVSGENIKTINNESILGDGNIDVISDVSWGDITGDIQDQADLQSVLDDKQDTLIGTETTGQNIKTINGNSILGTGDLSVSASASWGSITGTLSSQTDLENALNGKMPKRDVKQNDNVIGYEVEKDIFFGNYGNIKETSGTSSFYNCPTVHASEPTANNQLANKGYVDTGLSGKQSTLVSGTNIKTINNNSILGNGDISTYGDIIWTNSTPSSSFTPQTINVADMSDYKYIEIFFKKSGNETPSSCYRCLKGYDGDMYYVDDSFVLFNRKFVFISNTQIEFKKAHFFGGTANLVDTTDNNRCIPYYIIGYKEF